MQQSLLTLQAMPTPEHWQAPLVQISPQHWVPEVQLAPFPSQLQTPLVQVPPSQQSLVLPQPWPISLHAQLPWVQAVP